MTIYVVTTGKYGAGSWRLYRSVSVMWLVGLCDVRNEDYKAVQ